MYSGEFTVSTAAMIAQLAHHGQKDAGDPNLGYIAHPAAVYGILAGSGGPYADDEFAQMAAWLHDVVEDTWVTLEALRAAGAPEEVLQAVDALTQRAGEDREAYYERVKAVPRAWAVKIADVAHNSQESRLERLAQTDEVRAARLRRKYARAKEVLGSGPPVLEPV